MTLSPTTILDRQIGCFIGLAIGDAVGTTIEFRSRDSYTHLIDMVGGGPFGMPVGGWTDDTSQMLATTAALRDDPSYDGHAVMRHLLAWYYEGLYSHNGRCFDIGGSTSCALNDYARDRMIKSASKSSGGNGALCRVPALVLRFGDRAVLRDHVRDCTALTNGDPASSEAATMLASMLQEEISCPGSVDLSPYVGIPRDKIPSDGYAPHTLLAAVWAVANTDNFRDAVLLCANLGHDADSTAAVAGAIAGARYGIAGIPPDWYRKLKWRNRIIEDAKWLSSGWENTSTSLSRAHANSEFLLGFVGKRRAPAPKKAGTKHVASIVPKPEPEVAAKNGKAVDSGAPEDVLGDSEFDEIMEHYGRKARRWGLSGLLDKVPAAHKRRRSWER